MSGYSDEAVREFCKDRSQEIILFNGREVRGVATGEISFDELLGEKRDALRTYAHAWFWDGAADSVRSSHMRSGPDVIQLRNERKNWLLCTTGDNDLLFCNEGLDFRARHRGAVFSLYLRLDLRTVADLQRILRAAERQLGLKNEGSFSIHQRDVGWFGFGVENFITAVENQRSRYTELNWDSYHHSEELGYIDRIETGGLFCLSSRQATSAKNHLHTSEIEILIPGIPVEMDRVRRFCHLTGNPEAMLETVGEYPIKFRGFAPKVEVKPVATIVSHSQGEEWASGLVVKNPFLRRTPPFAEAGSVKEPFWLLSRHELLFCSLRSWHNPSVQMDHYELSFVEGGWVGNYPAFWLVCDWI